MTEEKRLKIELSVDLDELAWEIQNRLAPAITEDAVKDLIDEGIENALDVRSIAEQCEGMLDLCSIAEGVTEEMDYYRLTEGVMGEIDYEDLMDSLLSSSRMAGFAAAKAASPELLDRLAKIEAQQKSILEWIEKTTNRMHYIANAHFDPIQGPKQQNEGGE